MSEITNDGLDKYGAEPFEQQQFGTAGVEAVDNNIAFQLKADHRQMSVFNLVKLVDRGLPLFAPVTLTLTR